MHWKTIGSAILAVALFLSTPSLALAGYSRVGWYSYGRHSHFRHHYRRHHRPHYRSYRYPRSHYRHGSHGFRSSPYYTERRRPIGLIGLFKSDDASPEEHRRDRGKDGLLSVFPFSFFDLFR